MAGDLAQKKKLLTDTELESLGLKFLPKEIPFSWDQINRDPEQTKKMGNNVFILTFKDVSAKREFIESIKAVNDERQAKGLPLIASTSSKDIEYFTYGVKLDIAQLKEASKFSKVYMDSLRPVELEMKENLEVPVSSRTLEIQPALQAEATAQAKVVVANAEEVKKQTASGTAVKESAWKKFKDHFSAFMSNYSFSEAEANIDQTSRMVLESANRLKVAMQEQLAKKQQQLNDAKEAGKVEMQDKYAGEMADLKKRMLDLEALIKHPKVKPAVKAELVKAPEEKKAGKKLILADFLKTHGLTTKDEILLTEKLTKQLNKLDWLQDAVSIESGEAKSTLISGVKPPLPKALDKKCYAKFNSEESGAVIIAIVPLEGQLFAFKE